jgi:hypothetical protein
MDRSNGKQGEPCAALVGDLVGSRQHGDRKALSAHFEKALRLANSATSPTQALTLSVGDECQGVFAAVHEALDAALLVRLHLRPSCDVRFGVGWGEISNCDPRRGTAWWHAREAIEEVGRIESGRRWPRHVRTWVVGLDEPALGAVRAFLVARDALIARMDERDARILLGLFGDERQKDVAAEMGITQPSVARRQADNGPAAVFRAHEALRETGC